MAAETRRLVYVDVQRSEASPENFLLAIGDPTFADDNEVFILTEADVWALLSALTRVLNKAEEGR